VSQLEITRASQEDAEIILHLQIHAYLSEAEIYNDYSIPPLIQTLKEIKQEFSQQVFLNALEEGIVFSIDIRCHSSSVCNSSALVPKIFSAAEPPNNP
jgi:hypothetical protein